MSRKPRLVRPGSKRHVIDGLRSALKHVENGYPYYGVPNQIQAAIRLIERRGKKRD